MRSKLDRFWEVIRHHYNEQDRQEQVAHALSPEGGRKSALAEEQAADEAFPINSRRRFRALPEDLTATAAQLEEAIRKDIGA